jgi:hypothetical protein
MYMKTKGARNKSRATLINHNGYAQIFEPEHPMAMKNGIWPNEVQEELQAVDRSKQAILTELNRQVLEGVISFSKLDTTGKILWLNEQVQERLQDVTDLVEEVEALQQQLAEKDKA